MAVRNRSVRVMDTPGVAAAAGRHALWVVHVEAAGDPAPAVPLSGLRCADRCMRPSRPPDRRAQAVAVVSHQGWGPGTARGGPVGDRRHEVLVTRWWGSFPTRRSSPRPCSWGHPRRKPDGSARHRRRRSSPPRRSPTATGRARCSVLDHGQAWCSAVAAPAHRRRRPPSR